MSREDDIAAILKALDEYKQPLPLSDAEAQRVGAYIDAAARRMMKDQDMPNSIAAPRLDRTINYGHILTIAMIALSIGGATWKFSAELAESRRDIDNLIARTGPLASRIEASEQSNRVQDERLARVSEAVAEIRAFNSNISLMLGNIREDMATVKTELRRPNQPVMPSR